MCTRPHVWNSLDVHQERGGANDETDDFACPWRLGRLFELERSRRSSAQGRLRRSSVAEHVSGPVVLVGHSYGGSVISVASANAPNVKALVYVDAFAPEAGESIQEETAS